MEVRKIIDILGFIMGLLICNLIIYLILFIRFIKR